MKYLTLVSLLVGIFSLSSFACEYSLVDSNYTGGSEFIRKMQIKRVKRIMKRKGYELVEANASLELEVFSACDCEWEEGQTLPGSATDILLRKNGETIAEFSSGDEEDNYIYSFFSAPKKAMRQAIKKLKKELPECSE